MLKKVFALWLVSVALVVLLSGCAPKEESAAAPAGASGAVSDEPVTLTVAGSWPDCRALDTVASDFSKLYPNCTIVYEYLQDYYPSLQKRLNGEEPVDLFFTVNLQDGSDMLPYALNLYGREDLDLSATFQGLVQNFMYRGDPAEGERLYAIPLGADMRGLYVNQTLLDTLGIAVPTNQETLLAACRTLKEHGYLPFHGNPGSFSQTLLYPWICNLIANAEDPAAVYERVNKREPGISELLREPYSFLYALVENGYYDYKTAQTELGLFVDSADEDFARYFLHIEKKGEEWVKASDVGQIAFMPAPMSLENTIAKTKEDYHSEIRYVFIPAPIAPEGGFAYLSPGHGIAVYKDSQQQEWAARFLNFLFQPEHNQTFAKLFNLIPNTREAFSYIQTLFDLPRSHMSQLGQVTFDYGFYDAILPSMVNLSKANNPKYMQDDGNGGVTLYPLAVYMEELAAALQPQ